MTVARPGWEACGREALRRIDEILAKRPVKDAEALTEATKTLCLYRDGLIIQAKAGGEPARRDLEHANAVLSTIAAVHFPLGAIPWQDLEAGRGWLADLLERRGQTAG